jgi:hypothetical protein
MAVLLDWLAQVEVGRLDEGRSLADPRGKRRISIDIELTKTANSFIFRRGLDYKFKTSVSLRLVFRLHPTTAHCSRRERRSLDAGLSFFEDNDIR